MWGSSTVPAPGLQQLHFAIQSLTAALFQLQLLLTGVQFNPQNGSAVQLPEGEESKMCMNLPDARPP